MLPKENENVARYINRIARYAALPCSVLAIAFGLALLVSSAYAATPGKNREVKIGVLAMRGSEITLRQWRATSAYLGGQISAYSFSIVPLDFRQIGPAVRDGSIDFIITNPEMYVEQESQYGATRIATLKKAGTGAAATQFGGVIFCRNDRQDVKQLSDLKGKKFLAVDETAFGGWQMAWYEFLQQGIDPYKAFRTLSFAGTHDAVVYAVLNSEADAGTVRSGTLEKMAQAGKIDISQIRALNKKETGQYPFLLSTSLYPEWPIAQLKNTGDELSNAVAIALLSMPPTSRAARDAEIAGWTTPLNYAPVHDLMRELRLGPYRDYGKVTWAAIRKNHGYVMIAGAVALVMIGVLIVSIIFLNRRLQKSYKKSDTLRKEHDLILNSAGDGIFGLDNNGRHTFINSTGAAILGYKASELIGKPSHDTWHHTGKDGLPFPHERCPIYAVYHDGKTHAEDDDIFWRKDGTHFPVEYVSTPIMDESKVNGAVVVFKDITQKRKGLEALRKSEESFRSLFESSRDAIMLLDRKGFFDCNKATLDLFQCETKAQFVSRHPAELSPPRQPDGRESMGAAGERIEAAYAEGFQFFDWTHRRMDGSTFPAEVLLSRFELGDKTVLEAVVRDITERKNTEQTLRDGRLVLQQQHSELNRVFTLVELGKREWELSMDRLDDMIILLDADANIRRCNKKFQDLSGISYNNIIGSAWRGMAASLGFSDVSLGSDASSPAKEIYHAATNTWYRYDVYSYEDNKLNISGSIITLHNYTDAKRAGEALAITNEELEKNRSGLQDALDQLGNLLDQVIQNKDLTIRFENPNIKTCHEVMKCGKTSCVCYSMDNVRCWQIAGTYCGGKTQGVFVEKFGRCSECPIYRNAIADPIYMIGESFNNMMHILEDQHQELEKAYQDLKGAQSTILQQEKLASIGQLAAGVAHEINNPMGFITSNLGTLRKYADKLTDFIAVQETALKDLLPEQLAKIASQRKALKVDFVIDDLQSMVKESLDGAERIKRIVQDLKSFSRIDETEVKPADLNAGMESTINIVWNELKYKATITKEYGDIPQIKCNPGQLNQVFMNILMNAAHAIEKQGKISIKTWSDNGHILISIADTGCGIPQDKLIHIFEPFYTTKEVGKGTGLGLSIAYDIIKKHNGTIDVESTVGRGTTFTISIPVVTAAGSA